MATNMDKSLYAAPQGLEALAEHEPELQIEIEDPEAVTIKAGGMEIELNPKDEEGEGDFDENIAEEMDDRELGMLAGDLLGEYDADVTSRKDWLDTYVKGLKLLGLKIEERTEPWSGACGVFHPMLMEAAVKFESETIMETFPAMGPVKTLIVGKETPEAKESSIRVQADMNHELTDVMTEYRPEHERLLIALALSGNSFKKIYYDPALARQVAMFVSSEDLIVPYGAANLESAERITHKMRKTENELRRLQVAGFYRDVDLGEPQIIMDEVEKQKALDQGFQATADDRYQLLEMHVDIDLPGYEDCDKHGEPTGIALPYIVTIDKGTTTILAIRRNWIEDDPIKKRRQHFVHYGYIPGFGFYYFGLIHLIGGHAKAATSLMRQLIDAGTLSNLPGGLKSRGLRIKGDDTPIAPGEFRDVDVPAGAIRDNIMALPYKEPSQVLAGLLDSIVQDAAKFAATADLNVSDMSGQAPVGTTLAILERVLKVMSAVQARIHYSMKQEFRLLRDIIRDTTPDEYEYEPEVGSRKAKKADYDACDVVPVSDPNAATMSQKVVQYQAVMQLAQAAPQIYDLKFLHRQMIDVLGVKNVEKIIPMDDDMTPVDPITENMNIMCGKPVKAFLVQNHQAHLGVHMAAMKDPKLLQVMSQNPQSQAIQAAASAHIMEHIAFHYRQEMEKTLGAKLPAITSENGVFSEEEPMSPEMESQVAMLASQAAAQLLQSNQQQTQAQQAQQQQQDPLIQMQQQQLQISHMEAQTKQQKAQADIQLAQQRLKLEEQQAQQNAQLAQQRLQMEAQSKQLDIQTKTQQAQTDAQIRQADIQLRQTEAQNRAKNDVMNAAAKADQNKLKEAEMQHKQYETGVNIGADMAQFKAQLEADQRVEGVKMGIDIAKHKGAIESKHSQHADQINMQHLQHIEQRKQREQQAKQPLQQPKVNENKED